MWCWRTSNQTDHVRTALRVLALLVAFGGVPGHAQTSRPVESRVRVYPLDVILNGAPVGLWPVIERDGQVYALPEAFEAWRVQRPASAQKVEYKGLTYFSLAALPGAEVKVDSEQNRLLLNVRAEAFAGSRMKQEQSSAPARSEIVPSAFLNYDLTFTGSRTQDGATSHSLGLLGEFGFSNAAGLLTNSFAARDLVGSTSGAPKVVRLETTWRRDFPDDRYTLNVGDSVSRTGYLGRPTLFGGVQFGTNFGLTPQLNRQPLPVVTGQTLTPSTVQLYVNDVLRQTAKVPAGPFTLDSLPAISGNGDISVVVRDILGRETVITQPFFVAADLLAPGLNDWSVEAGKLREDLGSSSAHYSDAFASGMWRRGITTTFTGEARLEASRARSVAGAAGVLAIGRQFLVRGGAVLATDEQIGNGHRWSSSVDWQGRANSALLSVEGNSRNFRYLSEPRAAVPPRLQFSAQGGFFLSSYGRLGAAVAVQLPYDSERITTASLNYTKVLRDNWQLSVTVARAFGSASGTTVGAMLNIPLSKRNSSVVSSQVRQGQLDTYASVSHSPEGIYGTAWRVLGGYRTQARAEASLVYFGPKGIASSEISTSPDGTNLRLGANGGVLYTSGKVFSMPRHDMAAALVSVPGYAGIGVGLGQQVSARTDGDGYALISRLNAYQPNPIRLNPSDLPLTAEIDSIELPTVPQWRSVARVVFPVRGGRGAMISVVLEDGRPAPKGATVRISGEDRVFYVGGHGDTYVTGLKQSNRLQLRWRGASCDMDVVLPPGSLNDIARVGPITCKGAVRQ
jgi:outer membrane usher protein